MKAIFASFSLLLIACGGDPLDPGAGDDPGAGTNTLFVEGRATAEPRIVNARSESDFETDVEIRIRLNDQDVTSGTVSLTSRYASVDLTFDQDRWVGVASGYDEVYQLDIVSGTNEVTGVIVDGPDLHLITGPTAGASLDSTIANALSWDREEEADITTFKTDKIDRVTISDTGTYSIAPGSLDADQDQSKTNTLELRRTNRVVPAGAIGGSDFAVSIEQRLEVVALPNPAL